MTATAERYRAPFTSQRWQAAPLNGCRSVSLHHLRAFETLGESITWANGQPFGRAARTKQAEALRTIMASIRGVSVAAAPGFNRDEGLGAYKRQFPSGNINATNPTKADLINGLERGWVYSLSGDVKDVPDPNPIDDAVNETAHEIVVAPLKNKAGKWAVYEPMNSKVVWATLEQVWAFTKRFRSNRRAIGLRVKAGWDTQANRVRRDRQLRIDVLVLQRDALKGQRDSLQVSVMDLEEAVESAEQALIACREAQPDCGSAVAEARQRALDDAINALVDLQEAPDELV